MGQVNAWMTDFGRDGPMGLLLSPLVLLDSSGLPRLLHALPDVLTCSASLKQLLSSCWIVK